MNETKRKMPTALQIRKYWATRFDEFGDEFLDKYDFMDEVKSCMACGCIWGNREKPERAHIIARAKGGLDSVDNLHLLCWVCHKDSEYIEGAEYWDWLRERTKQDRAFSCVIRNGMGFNVATFFGTGKCSFLSYHGANEL